MNNSFVLNVFLWIKIIARKLLEIIACYDKGRKKTLYLLLKGLWYIHNNYIVSLNDVILILYIAVCILYCPFYMI